MYDKNIYISLYTNLLTAYLFNLISFRKWNILFLIVRDDYYID